MESTYNDSLTLINRGYIYKKALETIRLATVKLNRLQVIRYARIAEQFEAYPE